MYVFFTGFFGLYKIKYEFCHSAFLEKVEGLGEYLE